MARTNVATNKFMELKMRLPEYLRTLPDNATIGTLEMSQIHGVTMNHISKYVALGKVPMPVRFKRSGRKPVLRWRLGVVREYIKECNKKEILNETI